MAGGGGGEGMSGATGRGTGSDGQGRTGEDRRVGGSGFMSRGWIKGGTDESVDGEKFTETQTMEKRQKERVMNYERE